MKKISLPSSIIGSLVLLILSCTNTHTKTTVESKLDTTNISLDTLENSKTMTDSRDGETYLIVKIGEQVWMAENLRYNTPGSMLNPENPSAAYGRLYELIAAQTVCPNGWHLPSDFEWDKLEMAHGMPISFVGNGGWRGEHGTHMKSTAGWEDDGNGTNSLGFNILPAGYYFSGKIGEVAGMQGLGFSAAYWSSIEDNIGWARFLFSPRKWVNKWEDVNNETGAALACRCVKD